MFAIDPEIQRVHASREQIVTLVESINQPHLAVPGKQAQNAKAYVVGIRLPSGDFTLHVFLWLSKTNEMVVYSPDTRRVPLEAYRDTELEALQFCESMGFMTEPIAFRHLTPEAQDALFARLPPFGRPAGEAIPGAGSPAGFSPAPLSTGTVSPEQLEKLARLLGSF